MYLHCTTLPSTLIRDQFFRTCQAKEPERWLACLHVSKRSSASSKKPGPYDTLSWDLGRARLEKYLATYEFKGQIGEESLQVGEFKGQIWEESLEVMKLPSLE